MLLIIPTKYYQNISKGIKVMEHTRISTNFYFRGDNYITKKLSCLSCMQQTYCSSSSSLPNTIKLPRTVWELWPAQDFDFRGDNNIMKIVRVISFLCKTCLLVRLLIPTKYYQNMSKGIKVMECTRMRRWTNGRHTDHYIPQTYQSGD